MAQRKETKVLTLTSDEVVESDSVLELDSSRYFYDLDSHLVDHTTDFNDGPVRPASGVP